ncbi:MAG: hypothetical protein U1F68_00390 [Gammaproteobacteria bacterium]
MSNSNERLMLQEQIAAWNAVSGEQALRTSRTTTASRSRSRPT